MERVVSLNCIIPLKINILSREFHYIKCHIFHLLSLPPNNTACSPEKGEQKWWNEDFSLKYNYQAFCKGCKKQSGVTFKVGKRDTHWVFNVAVFHFDFFIGKKLFLPSAKQSFLCRRQAGFEFSQWGDWRWLQLSLKNGSDSVDLWAWR